MQINQFENWLTVRDRPLKANTANSYVDYINRCEELLNVDVDLEYDGGRLELLIDEINSKDEVPSKSRDNISTALRRYAEFRAQQ